MDTEDLSQGLRLRSSQKKSEMVPRVVEVEQANRSRDMLGVSHSEDQGPDGGKLQMYQGHTPESSNGLVNQAFENGNVYDPLTKVDRLNDNVAETTFTDVDNKDEEDGIEDITEECHQLLSSGGGLDRDGDDENTETIVFDETGGINVNHLIQSIHNDESSFSIMSQVSLPFIIAGFGTVGAGMVLDIVQHWDVFTKVGEIFILVPALLGLKGNLEMTLASRLSTQANLGNMDSRKETMVMVGGNMSLIQAQAIAVGFLSSLTAMVMGWIKNGEFNIDHALLLCASSLFTASIASLLLGSVMVLVILVSRYCRINPDNVATPIAASLGDLVTLTLLAWVGNLLWVAIGKQHWLAPVIIAFFLILLPMWVVICVRNKYTNDVIYTGWTPVLSAMIISSVSGLILDFAVAFYHGIAVFQPVINGVGGNLVAVHASRISTTLHLKGRQRFRAQEPKLKGLLNPFKVFFGPGVHSRAARVLTFLTIPGHLIFIYTISYMNAGHTSLSILFNIVYLTASLCQVIILVYIATWMVPMIWIGGSDPDNVAIPYLTAIGDFLGTSFLAIAFHILFIMGDRDADVGD